MKNIMPPINTPDKSFHDGNPATGEQGTIVSAEWLNNAQGSIRNTQQELLSVLTEAGMAIDENKTNQLLLAILNLITNRSPDLPIASTTQKGIVQLSNSTSSTSDALAATPKAVKAALDASLPIGGTAASATKLATARKIGGVDFDGTKDITLPFINTTDANVQLAGILGVKSLEVYPMPGSAEGGQIDLFDKDGNRVAFIDIDSSGNMRLVSVLGGVALVINKTTGDVSTPKALNVTGNITSGANVRAGNGAAWIAADGNVYGTQWGGLLSSYLSNRTVRAWAAVRGDGAMLTGFGFSSITRTNVGGYNFTMTTSNGAYAVTVGINAGSQGGGAAAHSPNIWNRTANSFSIQNSVDSDSFYPSIDWPEFYVIVVGP